jgi:hypothetical protein
MISAQATGRLDVGYRKKGEYMFSRWILLACLLGAGASAALASSFTFTTIVNPLGSGDPFGTVGNTQRTLGVDGPATSGINNAGQIVGTYYNPAGSGHGYLDSGGVFTGFDDPFASNPLATFNGGTQVNGINNTGEIVGEYRGGGSGFGINGFVQVPFVSANGGFITIDDPSSNQGYTEANGINDAGQVVGDYGVSIPDPEGGNELQINGFLLNGAVFTTIDDPLGFSTTLTGINNAGIIVGFYTDASGISHGFVDNGGVFLTIDDPLGTGGTEVEGINNNDQVVGFYIDGNGQVHGFLDTNPLGNSTTHPLVAGGSPFGGSPFTTIDDPSLVGGCEALGINDAGQIAGSCFNTAGSTGFVATPTTTSGGSGPSPVPEPATIFLLGTGLLATARYRIRRAR